MPAKQNTLTVICLMILGSRVAGNPLSVGCNIIPGLSDHIPLTLTRNENNSLMIGISTRIFYQSTLYVHTLTTSSVTLTIKSNQVLFKVNDNSIYLDAHLGGVLCWAEFYTGGMIKKRNGFSLGDQTSEDTCTSQCSISFTSTITTHGYISATGSIEGGSITTSSGHISSLSGNIQARNGTVGIKKDNFIYFLH